MQQIGFLTLVYLVCGGAVYAQAPTGTASITYDFDTGELVFDIGDGIGVIGIETVGNINTSASGTLGTLAPAQFTDNVLAYFDPVGLPSGSFDVGNVLPPGLSGEELGFVGFGYTQLGGETVSLCLGSGGSFGTDSCPIEAPDVPTLPDIDPLPTPDLDPIVREIELTIGEPEPVPVEPFVPSDGQEAKPPGSLIYRSTTFEGQRFEPIVIGHELIDISWGTSQPGITAIAVENSALSVDDPALNLTGFSAFQNILFDDSAAGIISSAHVSRRSGASYSSADALIPEPSAIGLVSISLVGMLVLCRRQAG